MSEFLRQITGLCLMGMVLDMILPEGDSRRFAELGVGLIAMLCMLRSLTSLLRGTL